MRANKGLKGLTFLVVSAILIAAGLVNAGCERRDVKKQYVVGIINPSSGLDEVVRGFREGMEEWGYIEGENITYLYDGPLDGVDKVDEKIAEMLAGNIDLIFSLTTPASRKLAEALKGGKVPGVFGPVFDPVESGVVASLSSPGGNVTGVKVRGSTPKALEWLLAIKPDVRRIYIPFHLTDKAACQTVDDLRETAVKFNIELMTEDVTTQDDLEKALAEIPDDADVLWLTCSHLLMSNIEKFVQAAESRKMPTASSTHSPYRSGILVSYGESDFVLGQQVSRLADKLLKGSPPSALPVETADFFLGINLQTARRLGIVVPEEVIRHAEYVVR